jgi:cell wall-associated NlpC family hydrolase
VKKRTGHLGAAALIAFLASLLLACGGGAVATRAPRWACPSPEPLPWGETGPVKEIVRHTRPISEGGDWEETVYYSEWEQEYGATHPGPPFPSPTPYALVGTSYVFGQRVEVWPFHVLVDARSGPIIDMPDTAPGTQQLYIVEITWVNHLPEELPVSYAEQVRLRAITDPAGGVISDRRWSVTALALEHAGIEELPTTIPTGESAVTVPILAPPGTPETVEISFEIATAAEAPVTPTATPVEEGSSEMSPPQLTVQWSNAEWRAPGAAPCGDPGALTDWSGGADVAWGREVQLAGVAAPPGADRLLQIVLNQVGKRYVWGAKGPETFDCSGLATWSYAQIGVVIPHGTGGQWPNMRRVERASLRPGDLVFFDIAGRGRVDHVGVLMGDLNGDGTWDMVHAASAALGVRIDYSIFESAAYGPRILGFRTATTGGGV